MAYQLLKKQAAAPVSAPPQAAHHAASQPGGVSLAGEGMGAQLDARMQARMQQFLDHQNPAAEQEADEIAASVSTARTPQEVKAQLGERMGADFSNVRFHTGSDAIQRAEGIGARAYATGRDIYFGEGGFDPAVAAHELVHTAQQGVVDSGMATQSMPAGTVQMMPKLLKTIGSGIKRAASAAWGGIKSVGSSIGHGVKSAASTVWGGLKSAGSAIKGLFAGGGQQAAPAQAPAPAPAVPQYANEQEEYQAMADQMKAGYANARIEGATPQDRYIKFLSNYNRNNANFPAFKSSTSRIRNGQPMKQAVDSVFNNATQRYAGPQGADELNRIGGLMKQELQTDPGAAQGIQSFSNDMMDQMSVLMDDPEYQRYLLANANGLRGATQGRQGTEDFFGDDHMLTLTLLNNMNLYGLNPSLLERSRSQGNSNAWSKIIQSSTGIFNGMTSIHAKMGENVGEDQAALVAQTLQSGRGKEIDDDEALLNLRNQHLADGKTDFTPEEIEGMKNELYAGKANAGYSEEGVRKYLALYQKMRRLIGQQQG